MCRYWAESPKSLTERKRNDQTAIWHFLNVQFAKYVAEELRNTLFNGREKNATNQDEVRLGWRVILG